MVKVHGLSLSLSLSSGMIERARDFHLLFAANHSLETNELPDTVVDAVKKNIQSNVGSEQKGT